MKKKSDRKEKKVIATCSACKRKYNASEALVAAVQAGKLESLCGGCSGENQHVKK